MKKNKGLVWFGVCLLLLVGFAFLFRGHSSNSVNQWQAATSGEPGVTVTDSKEKSQASRIIPPAPPYSGPVLRADQLAQVSLDEETETPAGGDVVSAVTTTEEKNGAFSTEVFLDPSMNRPIKVVSRELIVRFSDTCSTEERELMLSNLGATVVDDSGSSLAKLGYIKIRVPDAAVLEVVASNLDKNPLVAHVEPNVIVRTFNEDVSDVSIGDQWGLNAIKAPEVWEQTQGDPSIVIAVIDSGVDLDHPNLVNNVVEGMNLIDKSLPPDDDYGHGTQVAGIIVAHPVGGLEISGVAPKCNVMPFKVIDGLGQGGCSDVAEAIVMATDQGCRIINLSLGTYFQSGLLEAAVEYANDNNCVVVAAGGNDGSEEPCYPAAYAQTIGVSALGRGLTANRFSNRASYIDVSAPGEQVQTTTLDGSYESVDGTSASAAHVSGMASLLLTLDENLSQDVVRAVIRNSAKDLDVQGWDNATGMGLIDCVSALSLSDLSIEDAGIIDVMVLPNSPLPGQMANVYVTVRNHGMETSEPRTVLLKHGDDIVSSDILPILSQKAVSEIRLPWSLSTNSTFKSALLVAEVEPHTQETRLADNTHTATVNIASNAVCDVAILGCKVIGAPLSAGAAVDLELTIVNKGNQQVEDVPLQFLFRNEAVVPDRAVSLGIGECITFKYEWTSPIDVPDLHALSPVYTLVFKIGPVENEQDNQDNTCVVRLGYEKKQGAIVPFHKVASGQEVHQWIAKEAYDYFVSQIEGADLASYLGTISGSFSVGNNDLLEGTYAEDRSNRDPLYQGITEPDLLDGPFLRHFVAGADGSEIYDGLAAYSSAYEQALNIWNNYAVTDYPANKARAFYRLGHVAHLLTDMTVPAHTHNDAHPISESYEDAMGYNDQFQWWYYGCSRSGDWDHPLTLFANLYSIFYRTANYTEDYDSDDEDGDAPPYYNPSDYSNSEHDPGNVDRSGGLSSTELTIIADDLMPSAIRRVADLYRLFYSEVDSSSPAVSMTYPTSTDVNNPTMRTSTSAFNLTASASDSQSGVLKNGYQYHWSYWTGSTWSDWFSVSPSPTDSSVSFAPSQGDALYAFTVIGENGGGLQTQSSVKYLRITSDDAYEENDTRATAYDLSGDEQTWLSTISGLGIQADDDWYEIYVSSGYENVLIDCQFTDSDGDIDIQLVNSSGTVLDESDSTSDDEYIDYVVPSSGTYYIRVHYGDAGNSYNLWWDDVQPPSPGTLQFKSSSYSVDENGGSIRIYVSRSGGSSGAASVNYATANGSATSGSDYTSKSGTLNWSDGDSADKYFDVSITDDSLAENAETFTANLSSASGASMGSPNSTTVTINGPNDQPSTYTLSVNGGSGDGSYASGSVVPIVADAPPSNHVFNVWTVAPSQYAGNLGSATSPSTSFTMPEEDVSVTATYKIFGGGDTAFFEDWESGEIKTNKWKAWGAPAPSIVSGGNSIGAYALTSNGDANYDSGVTSLQRFEVRPGLYVSAEMFIQAPGTDVWSKRSWQGIQLSSRPPAEWDNSKGWSDSTVGPAISIRGNTPLDTGLGISIPGGGTNFSSSAWVDRWTEVGFVFNEDGSVTYLIEGEVLYTTAAGWIDYASAPEVSLVCGGRSEGSSVTNLHDNIQIFYSEFFEDWESSVISTNKWKIWGFPAPTIVSGGNSIGAYALTSNGDANYDSGVTSLQSFEVRPGLTASAKMFIQAPGTDVWSKRSWQGIQLSTRVPETWDNSKGWSDSTIGPAISIRGNTPLDTGLGIRTPDGGTNYSSAAWVDRWTDVAFRFNWDGSVTYYVDGDALYTTAADWIDYDSAPAVYLVCGGRSEGSSVTNLHDNIQVYTEISAINDSDHDGQTDGAEAIAGTSPYNPASYFSITNYGVSASFVLEWSPCVTGRWYSVLWTPSLTNSFEPMEDYIDPPQNSYTDTVHAAESAGFYKVEVRRK